MAKSYVTAEGDALDLVCLREYGREAGAVEPVLEANPHIRDVAHRMPRGLTITLPDLNVGERVTPLRLWD